MNFSNCFQSVIAICFRRLGFVLPLVGIIARGIVFLFVVATKVDVHVVYVGYILEGNSIAIIFFFFHSGCTYPH